MAALIFVHGPNGVGKSTVCRAVHQRLDRSAWLESEWCRMTHPFAWNAAIVALTTHNIAQMLRGYLSCSWLDYVIFSYGFHGPRRRIWDAVLAHLEDVAYTFVPITLTCAEAENVARMQRDGRDAARIARALAARSLYEGLPHPRIDTTRLTVDEAAARIVEMVRAAV